jgi:hypothetical protein
VVQPEEPGVRPAVVRQLACPGTWQRREVTPMKRFIQIVVTLLALAVIVWGAFFSHWLFAGERMGEAKIMKRIADGVCLS